MLTSQFVLIVEPDDRAAREISGVCREAGLQCKISPDGLHALMLAIDEWPDLIILNKQVAGLDSPEVFQKVARQKRRSCVPVIEFERGSPRSDRAWDGAAPPRLEWPDRQRLRETLESLKAASAPRAVDPVWS